jgi:hypothetical protein
MLVKKRKSKIKLIIDIETFGAGYFIHKDKQIIHEFSEYIYIDVRCLEEFNININNLGTDKEIRIKYLKNNIVKEFYKTNILFPVRKIINEKFLYINKKFGQTLLCHDYDRRICVYIYSHKGKHKSICLAEQLYEDIKNNDDIKKKCEVNINHLDIYNENNNWNDKDSRANYFLTDIENPPVTIYAKFIYYEITVKGIEIDINNDSYWKFLKYFLDGNEINKLKQGSFFDGYLNLSGEEYIGGMDTDYRPIWEYIQPALKEMTSLKCLDLSHNAEYIDLDDYKELVPVLKKMKALKKIFLEYNGIHYEELKVLIPVFKEMNNLEEINLSYNYFGLKGCKLLASILPQMKLLKKINLKVSEYKDRVDIKDFHAFKQMKNIEFILEDKHNDKINIDDSDNGEEDAKEFNDIPLTNEQLKELEDFYEKIETKKF